MLASVETLFSGASHRDDERDVITFRFRGTQAGTNTEPAAADGPTFTEGDLTDWVRTLPAQVLFRLPQPIAALTRRSDWTRDSTDGLGLPRLAIAPTAALVAALEPTTPRSAFEIHDGDSALAALRTWRSLYQSSGYHQPWPQITGTALVVTRVGFNRLNDAVPCLVMGDFILQREAREFE